MAAGSASGGLVEAWGLTLGDKGQDVGSNARGSAAPETYKRGTLRHPSMVTKAPGLASLIPLAVKEHIWRKEFFNFFHCLRYR